MPARHATLVAAAAVLIATPATGFAPTPACRSALLRPAQTSATLARTPAAATAARQRPAVIMREGHQKPFLAKVSRAALLLATSLIGILFRALPALAVSTARRSASSSGIPMGDIVKYGSVVSLLGAAYAFRREETPILTETPMEENAPPSEQGAAAETTAVDASPSPAASFNDGDLNSALLARMQALARERDAEEETEDASEPSNDSTDGWGEGSTAVLEPPKPSDAADDVKGGLLDGEPAVEFPTGFPLIEAEWDDQPAASEDQVAMLQRMFGGAGPDLGEDTPKVE